MAIFLHRPYVSDGHLQSASASVARDAFSICASAALEINHILRLYRRHFSLHTAPYFISYATYVSATIHVRMAAQRRPGSGAHRCLRNCLEILVEQQTRCYAPRRTLQILLDLAGRLRVDVGDFSVLGSSGDQIHDDGRGNQDGSAGYSSGLCPPSEDNLTQEASEPTTWSNQDVLGAYDIGSDPMLVDIDIDEIIKSFDLASKDAFQRAPQSNQDGLIRPEFSSGGPQQAAANSGLDITSSMTATLDVEGGFFLAQDTLSFPDSLFGLDFDASWLPSSSD